MTYLQYLNNKHMKKILIAIIMFVPLVSFAASYTIPWQATSTNADGFMFPYKMNGSYPKALVPSINASSTYDTNYFAGNVMIGNSMFNGQLDISSLGTGLVQLQVSTSTNDFAKVTYGNVSSGNAAAFCNIYHNARTPRTGINSSYYGGICFAGPNYNLTGFDGVKPNGIALFASDGDVSLGSASANAASSSIRFFVGGNSAAFSASGQDAILQGGTGNFGIRVSNPTASLAVSERHGSGTPALGSELTDATGWTSTDWTGDYSTGFTHTAGNTTNLSRTMTVANTSYYQIAFTISGRTAGSVTVALGYATTSQTFSANQAHGVGHRPVTTNGPLVFIPTTDFNGTISGISVKVISAVSNPIFVLHDSAGTAGVEFRQGTSSLQNTFMGSGAGSYNTTGNANTAQGYQALRLNTTGIQNTVQGYQSIYSNTTGTQNTGQGYRSLYVNTTGSYNSAQGNQSLYFNTTGSYNTAQGASSLYSNTTGVSNTAQGYQALYSNTTGSYNSANGYASLYSNTTGAQNSAQGVYSLFSNTTGSNNVGQGYYALRHNQSATNTTAVGYQAGRGTANYNSQGGVYLGYQAGYSAGTGGDYNTLLGYQAGYNITTGSDNIIIGQNVNATSSNSGAGLNIGNVLYGVGMYSGSSVSATPVQGSAIGVGSSSPQGKFSIQGFANGTMPIATFATSSATNVYKTVLNIDKDGTLDTKYGIYCQMYSDNGMVTTSVPTGTTYTKISAFSSTTKSVSSKYCTPTPASSLLTITKAGKYRANVSVSFSGTISADFRGALFVDGLEESSVHFRRKLGTGGDVDSASASGIFTATSTSVVDFRVRHGDGSPDDFTVHYGNVNVEYIGE